MSRADRKAKPGAAFILVAGVVEPEGKKKRLEHFLAHGERNARTVVIDRQPSGGSDGRAGR